MVSLSAGLDLTLSDLSGNQGDWDYVVLYLLKEPISSICLCHKY